MTASSQYLERMRDHSFTLYQACSRLFEQEPTGVPGSYKCFPVPAIILAALSIEVGLKALVMVDRTLAAPSEVTALMRTLDRTTKGHDLRLLFSLLPASQMKRISDRTHSSVPFEQSLTLVINQLSGQTVELKFYDSDVPGELESAKRAFEVFRYSYEHPDPIVVNETFLTCLSKEVQELLREILPPTEPNAI